MSPLQVNEAGDKLLNQGGSLTVPRDLPCPDPCFDDNKLPDKVTFYTEHPTSIVINSRIDWDFITFEQDGYDQDTRGVLRPPRTVKDGFGAVAIEGGYYTVPLVESNFLNYAVYEGDCDASAHGISRGSKKSGPSSDSLNDVRGDRLKFGIKIGERTERAADKVVRVLIRLETDSDGNWVVANMQMLLNGSVRTRRGLPSANPEEFSSQDGRFDLKMAFTLNRPSLGEDVTDARARMTPLVIGPPTTIAVVGEGKFFGSIPNNGGRRTSFLSVNDDAVWRFDGDDPNRLLGFESSGETTIRMDGTSELNLDSSIRVDLDTRPGVPIAMHGEDSKGERYEISRTSMDTQSLSSGTWERGYPVRRYPVVQRVTPGEARFNDQNERVLRDPFAGDFIYDLKAVDDTDRDEDDIAPPDDRVWNFTPEGSDFSLGYIPTGWDDTFLSEGGDQGNWGRLFSVNTLTPDKYPTWTWCDDTLETPPPFGHAPRMTITQPPNLIENEGDPDFKDRSRLYVRYWMRDTRGTYRYVRGVIKKEPQYSSINELAPRAYLDWERFVFPASPSDGSAELHILPDLVSTCESTVPGGGGPYDCGGDDPAPCCQDDSCPDEPPLPEDDPGDNDDDPTDGFPDCIGDCSRPDFGDIPDPCGTYPPGHFLRPSWCGPQVPV